MTETVEDRSGRSANVETPAFIEDPRDDLIAALVAENNWLRSKVAWGYAYGGNAYRRTPPPPKPEPKPLDVREDAPHG